MKRLSACIALFLVFSFLGTFLCHAKDLEIYSETTTGDFRIVYTKETPIATGRGVIMQYENCGVLDSAGNFVVEPIYESINPFKEGRALFKKDGKYGFFDENWQVAVQPQYIGAGEFSEGLANVAKDGWIQGYIDKCGNTVIPFEYSSTSPFANGVATVGGKSQEGYYFHTFTPYGKIDKQGNIIEPIMFDHSMENLKVIKSQSMIDINGRVYDNRDLEYPFINYLGYAYIPLTYEACRALGIVTEWSAEKGLAVSKGTQNPEPPVGTSVMPDGIYENAQLCKQVLTINGKAYRHTDIYYPLIFYKDIIYLPVLWRQGMEALGIEYEYVLPQGMEGKIMGTMKFTTKN